MSKFTALDGPCFRTYLGSLVGSLCTGGDTGGDIFLKLFSNKSLDSISYFVPFSFSCFLSFADHFQGSQLKHLWPKHV